VRRRIAKSSELRERVTGVEPATLCLASQSTPVTTPSQPIAQRETCPFNFPHKVPDGFDWNPIRYTPGTHSTGG
jgi:hypothetical protein